MLNLTYDQRVPGLLQATLETCKFPIIPGVVGGYKVLQLPDVVRRIFDQDGASVVRINSLEVANSIPDYGGRGSGENFSLLPHQDHLDPSGDARRFLMLTKLSDGARGSSTIAMTPTLAETLLPLEEVWVKDETLRAIIGRERKYDVRFQLTEEQYNRCFDEDGGYERVVAEVLGENPSAERTVSVRLGLLGFLMRGASADEVMRQVMRKCQGKIIVETWERGGILIIDNPAVFHARFGGNTPALQRNFCT